MPNPFIFGAKIANAEHFVGRRKELKKIFGFLNTEHTGQIQHVSVVGERRIGKSSLLYHLTQVNQKHFPNTHENYQFLYLNLQDPRCHSLSGLLHYILEELHLTRPSKVTLGRFYEIIEEEREKNGTWIVLLMDEFEKLIERSDEFTDDFYDSLRSLGDNNLVGIITASKIGLEELSAQKKLTSPFFNIFHQIELGEFTDNERDILLTSAYINGKSFSEDICQKIIKIAGNHPARLQIVSSLVYEAKLDKTPLNWKEISQEAKNEPAFNSNSSHNGKSRNWFLNALNWFFITFPKMIGRIFFDILKSENVASSSEWIAGAMIVLILLGSIIGIIPWALVTKTIRRFSELFIR